MRRFLLILITLFSFSFCYSQVSVTATATDSVVFCGLCTDITADGIPPYPSTLFTFDWGWPAGWDVPACGMLTNPCGPGTYAWMGPATSAPRTLATNGFNTSCGGTICFDFRMAPPVGGGAPCEDPDLPTEGMYIEYSIDGGSTWVTMDYFDPTTYGAFSYEFWETFCYPIPVAAETPNTMFRWHQANSSGMCCDHWGIDNVELLLGDCGYYYDWTHIAGYPDSPNITVCPSVPTTYTVLWTNGINDTTSVQVDIDVVFSDVEITLSTTEPIDSCGDCVEINGTIINPDSVPYVWNWSGPNVTNINDSTVSVCPSDDAWYSVNLSANGCDAEDSVYVEVNIPMASDALDISPNECSPATIEIDNTLDGSNCQYTITGPATYTHTGCGPFSNVYPNHGVYDVYLTMLTPDGCVMDSLFEDAFEVYQTPIASFIWTPYEPTIIENYVQFNNTTTGGQYYFWDLGDGTTSTDIHVSNTYEEVGMYDIVLEASTQWGCTDTAYGRIYVKDDLYLYVPNAFTPDGNLFNNEFKPVISRHDIYDYSLTIYNRWGETMFVSYNSDFGWDGTYGNGIAQDGMYTWVIRATLQETAETKIYTGHVSLMR